MRRMWQGLAVAGVVSALTVLAAPAHAFFPIGGFGSNGVLYYQTWDLSIFDTNSDGNVQTGEGLEYLLESGASGFTPTELDEVRESLQVWQDVPTSYVAFREAGLVTDPILTGIEPDFMTTIAMQVTEGDGDDVVPDLPDVQVPFAFPVLGVTLTFWTVEETVLTVGGTSVSISPGTIIDSDIVILADSHRTSPEGEPPLVELKATMVHEVGHLLGLDHPPLNNLEPLFADPSDPDSLTGLVEKEVFWFTEPNGIARFVGVTPTMFPFAFELEDSVGERNDGSADLAPDDISGISWLYPRGSQARFFNVADEALTRTGGRVGVPSVPIVGAHVVAWADLDNNPGTSRVPMFSTMTGLYVNLANDLLEGRFNIINLWKQIEVPRSTNGALFNPSYTFTMNPLNGTSYENQAPPGVLSADTDSIQGEGESSTTPRGAGDYNNAFPSEVFRESENTLGVQNHDAGTAMVWNFERNTLISADSGKTLAQILRNRPMFGEEAVICPLNLIYGADGGGGGGGGGDDDAKALVAGVTGSGGGPGILRGLRDNFLLKSAVGTAAVDAYYTISPQIVAFLLDHATLAKLFKRGVGVMYWMLEHRTTVLAAMAAFSLVLVLVGRRRSGWARAVGLGLILCLSTLPAQARIAFQTTPQMTSGADAVVSGTIRSVQSRVLNERFIVTDAVLDVEHSLKGAITKQTQVTVTVLGGKVGALQMRASETPTFEAGQEVLLYLREDDTLGYTVHGGIRGTFEIHVNKESGEKVVQAWESAGEVALKTDAGKMSGKAAASLKPVEGEEAKQTEVPLAAYLEFLQGIIDAQEADAAS